MNQCFLPGNDYPIAILLGASGTGRTSVGESLARTLNVELIEAEHLAEQFLSKPLFDAFNEDLGAAHGALDRAAQLLVRESGAGAGAVVTLSPSSTLKPEVIQLLEEASSAGTPIIGLEASLGTLARRAGLNASRPVFLGTPRAWFRDQIAQVNSALEPVVDQWFETDQVPPEETAATIANALQLDLNN